MAVVFEDTNSQYLSASPLFPTEAGAIAIAYIFKQASNPLGDYPQRFGVATLNSATGETLNYSIYHLPSALQFHWTNGTNQFNVNSGAWTSDTNEHTVMFLGDWNNNSFKIWLDGVDLSATIIAGSATNNPDTASMTRAQIGLVNYTGTTEYYNGWIAEFMIWQGVTMTTADALMFNARMGRQVQPSFCTRYFPLVNVSRVNDVYGGSIGTVFNTPTTAPHPRVIYPSSRQARRLIVPLVIRPDADISDGTWTDQAGGTSLFAAIDEPTQDDADYIQSADTPSNDTCEVNLSNFSSGVGQPIRVYYRYWRVGSTGSMELRVRLLQGATQIASWTHSAIGTTPVDAVQTLSGGEAAAISDFTNLRLEFRANQT